MLAVPMIALIATGCATTSTTSTKSATFTNSTVERIYVPTAASYIDGEFIGVAQVGHPEETMRECMEKLQRTIGGVLENDSVPEGGSVLGACESLPKAFVQPRQ